MSITRDPEETRAIALVSMSLGYALTGMLKRMGVLEAEAIQSAFEAALSGVETSFPQDDRSAALARQFLDLMDAGLAPVKSNRLSGTAGRPSRDLVPRPA